MLLRALGFVQAVQDAAFNMQHTVVACVLGTTSSVETSETWPRRSETWMRRTASELSAHIGCWKNCTRDSLYYPSPSPAVTNTSVSPQSGMASVSYQPNRICLSQKKSQPLRSAGWSSRLPRIYFTACGRMQLVCRFETSLGICRQIQKTKNSQSNFLLLML